MSDLRPQGIEVEIGGKQRSFLFTLNVIDEVQEKCNMPLVDTMKSVVDVIDNNATNHEAITVFKAVVAALLNGDGSEEKLEAEGHTVIAKGRKNIKYYVQDYEQALFCLG